MSEHVMTPPTDAVEFSNAIRLTVWQWFGVVLASIAFVVAAPWLWKQAEPLAIEPDYRMPEELSDDYWFYRRYVGLAVEQHDTVVLGDSVVWGKFVSRHETLSHYLNTQAGADRFANLGLNGAHPLALDGLIENYGGAITNRDVLLHCNPMWMRDAKTDLQDVDADVNHPNLLPQFVPRIPAYKAEVSHRLGVVVERRVPFSMWTNHLQKAYYRTDIPSWTLAHPYDNPLGPLAQSLPPPTENTSEDARPWYKRGIARQNFEWIDLDSSLQWHAFQRAVETLQKRGNRVFVVVGPFNEHMLTPASHERYQKVKATIAAWLAAKQIPHLVPDVLPSEQYGDASHPLPEGYAILARQVSWKH